MASASPAESAAAEREEEEKEEAAPELSAGAATAASPLQRTGVPLRGAAVQAAVGGVKISKHKTKARLVLWPEVDLPNRAESSAFPKSVTPHLHVDRGPGVVT